MPSFRAFRVYEKIVLIKIILDVKIEITHKSYLNYSKIPIRTQIMLQDGRKSLWS